MRLLLDECVDRRFADCLSGHEVKTVPQMGWAGLKNGQLLDRAEEEFDVFITVDRGLPSQQNLSARRIAILVMRARSNHLVDLESMAPKVLAALPHMKPGYVMFIGYPGGTPPQFDIVADAPRSRKRKPRAIA